MPSTRIYTFPYTTLFRSKLRMDVRPSDPSSFIDAAVEAVRPAAEAKGVRVQKVMDTGAVSIPGDPVRLQQVVWNLLSNAIKFRSEEHTSELQSHVNLVCRQPGFTLFPTRRSSDLSCAWTCARPIRARLSMRPWKQLDQQRRRRASACKR